MQFSEPRVLVVSHNVFSASGNMGKTMMHMLAGISPDNLAQLYFHQEIPTRSCCLRYFRITDSNVLHALFTRRAEYRVFEAADIDESASQSRTDTGSLAKIYQFSRRRTPLIYFLRDLMWRLGKWNTPALLEWVQSFSPDVIFFAAGDYAFPYRIALRLSALLHIPIVMWCADDFYIEPLRHGPLLRRMQCRRLVKLAEKIVRRSGTVVTISDMMQRDYARLFQTPKRSGSPANPILMPCPKNPAPASFMPGIWGSTVLRRLFRSDVRSRRRQSPDLKRSMYIPASGTPPFFSSSRKKTV